MSLQAASQLKFCKNVLQAWFARQIDGQGRNLNIRLIYQKPTKLRQPSCSPAWEAEKHPCLAPHCSGGPCGSAVPSALKESCQRFWLQLAHGIRTLNWHCLNRNFWKLNQGILPCSKILDLVRTRAVTCYTLCLLHLTVTLLLGTVRYL